MSTEQSERIRAALLRAKASRQPNQPSTVESLEQPQVPDTQEIAAENTEPASTEPPSAEPAEDELEMADVDTAELETAEVEDTLPLVAASDHARAIGSPAVVAAQEDRPRLPETPIESGGTSNGRVLRIALLAGAILAVAGLGLFLFKQYGRSDSKPAVASAAPLQLQVESQGNGIISIRWNPESTAITAAKEGRLLILERDQQPRTVGLAPDQLKIGHMFYQSPAEPTEFRLEVVSPSGAVAKESVLALASGKAAEPSAGPPVAPATSEAPKENAKPQEVSARDTKTELPLAAKTPEVRPPAKTVTRSFTPPPIPSQSKTTDSHSVTLEPPPSVANASVVPPVSVPDTAARIPAPQLAPPPAAPAAPPLKSGGELRPPKLMKRITPVYPSAAQAAGIQGKVRFTARIDKQGMVRDLQVVSGPSVLIPSATDAVKRWIYQPMLLNGEPTDVVTQIEVNFTLHE